MSDGAALVYIFWVTGGASLIIAVLLWAICRGGSERRDAEDAAAIQWYRERRKR